MKRFSPARWFAWTCATALTGCLSAPKMTATQGAGAAALDVELAPPAKDATCTKTEDECAAHIEQALALVPPSPEGVLDAVRRRFDALGQCVTLFVAGSEPLAVDVSIRIDSLGSVGDVRIDDVSGRLDLAAEACMRDALRAVRVDVPNDGGTVRFRLNVTPSQP